MPEPADLVPTTFEDLAQNIACGLRYRGRKRVHDAGNIMAQTVAERLVNYPEESGYMIIRKPPAQGHAALGRGHRGE